MLILTGLFLSATALAQTEAHYSSGPSNINFDGHWAVEFITSEGKYSRIFGSSAAPYLTEDACKAAMPAVLKQQGGFDGHCVQFKSAKFIGSHDPALPENQ
jgi:hypothetical protein